MTCSPLEALGPSSSRIIDFVALKKGWVTGVLDCTSAFFHAPETEEVYVKPPAEWLAGHIENGGDPTVMWRLLKQLPGRRTAGVRWIDFAKGVLTNELNLERCESNPCFYKEDGKSLLELHMDDIHVTARSESEYEDLISKIREHLAIVASPPLVAGS